MTLSPDASEIKDPLFDVILRRQSNKRAYTEMPLSADQLARLRTFRTDPSLQLTITDDASVRNELSEIMIEAMRIETSSKSRDAETIATLMTLRRFNSPQTEAIPLSRVRESELCRILRRSVSLKAHN